MSKSTAVQEDGPVLPARFHDHAETLRNLAAWFDMPGSSRTSWRVTSRRNASKELLRIADDIDSDA